MDEKTLNERIANMAPPPCEGCPNAHFCATTHQACERYYAYTRAQENRPGHEKVSLRRMVKNGDMTPNIRYYRKIFGRAA